MNISELKNKLARLDNTLEIYIDNNKYKLTDSNFWIDDAHLTGLEVKDNRLYFKFDKYLVFVPNDYLGYLIWRNIENSKKYDRLIPIINDIEDYELKSKLIKALTEEKLNIEQYYNSN